MASHNKLSHDSICVSNACPSCHAHLSRAYPALCPHCRSHLPSVPSSSLCESSSLLLQSRQKLNFGSPKNSTGPRSAFTSPNVKIGSPLTSTPVAGVPAQMKASYLGGFPIHSTHINLGKIITLSIYLKNDFFMLPITYVTCSSVQSPVVFLRIKIFRYLNLLEFLTSGDPGDLETPLFKSRRQEHHVDLLFAHFQ